MGGCLNVLSSAVTVAATDLRGEEASHGQSAVQHATCTILPGNGIVTRQPVHCWARGHAYQ